MSAKSWFFFCKIWQWWIWQKNINLWQKNVQICQLICLQRVLKSSISHSLLYFQFFIVHSFSQTKTIFKISAPKSLNLNFIRVHESPSYQNRRLNNITWTLSRRVRGTSILATSRSINITIIRSWILECSGALSRTSRDIIIMKKPPRAFQPDKTNTATSHHESREKMSHRKIRLYTSRKYFDW